MATQTIYVKANSRQVMKAIARAVQMASGESGGATIYRRQLLVRVGLVALGRIKDAFITKSAGGTDESGLRWAPLKPETIAYTRRHPKLNRRGGATKNWIPKGPARAKYAPSYMLTQKQRDRWWTLYRRFGGKSPAGAAYHRSPYKRAWAAARAWVILKSEGARTLLGVYGHTKVDILRDSGLLLKSLSPAIPPEQAISEPPKVDKQVFRIGKGNVIVGTNRKFAYTHHQGIPGKLPQRRLWPEVSKWPKSWWRDIGEQAAQGVSEIIQFLLKGK